MSDLHDLNLPPMLEGQLRMLSVIDGTTEAQAHYLWACTRSPEAAEIGAAFTALEAAEDRATAAGAGYKALTDVAWRAVEEERGNGQM